MLQIVVDNENVRRALHVSDAGEPRAIRFVANGGKIVLLQRGDTYVVYDVDARGICTNARHARSHIAAYAAYRGA